jgi:hypothetical protein
MENIDNWRYELKYIVSDFSSAEVLSYIKLHPAMFSEVFYQRQVNNIYFDTPDFSAFSDNVIGISKRLKIRCRWYGDTFGLIENPILELKIKDSAVGRKESLPLERFTLTKHTTANNVFNLIKSKEMTSLAKRTLLVTRPVLINSYSRRYFLSSCGRFRITYDVNLKFHSFIGNRDPKIVNQNILEVKFSKKDMSYIKNIMSHFPFRLNKSSKYVTGISELIMTPDLY